jgi:energy-coupling factor transport system permease protein
MVVRIVVLVLGTSLFLTYTTTPIALTDGLESLLKPLRLIRVPVHEFAMMMTIALRFIPLLSEETGKIMNAQKARGVDFSRGGLIQRAKSLIPILIPLFVSAFRRAEELATAMECRCYRGGAGRTKMTVPHLHVKDFAALSLMILFGASILLLSRYSDTLIALVVGA